TAFATEVRASGLLPRVWQGPVDPVPTLGAMVRRDQRVLVLAEEDAGDVPWLHRQFDVMGETPYDLTSAAALLSDAGFVPGRGGTAPPLLLLNQFAEAVPPSVAIARRVNAR